jgi:hypothetical protein
MQNKASLQKFHIMAQSESRMSIQKAIAIWKHNSEVQGIDGILEHKYRNLTLIRLNEILTRQIKM